jgi:hypothetical protein
MAEDRGIRSFDYVNHPYERVREILTTNAVAVFREATQAATSRTRAVASALRVDIAGLEIAKEIAIDVRDVTESAGGAKSTPVTRLAIEWKAATTPGLFPFMKAELAVYPLTATETQLDFSGNYEPPGGWLGSAVDAVVGHKIAEASVHRFVSQVAGYLREHLSA